MRDYAFSRVALLLALLWLGSCDSGPKKETTENVEVGATLDQQAYITIGPDGPQSLPAAASALSLEDAARYAWNQFIALNWPAVDQTGAPNTRDMPDRSALFGQNTGQPLVWHTYRSKVELYPFGQLPPGTTRTPDGNGLVFNYDAAPEFLYGKKVSPCTGESEADAPWINLDEVTQIGLNTMYRTINSSGQQPQAKGSADPRLIRYLAKANRTYADYIYQRGYYNHGSNGTDVGYFDAIKNYTNAIKRDAPIPTDSIVYFPEGTIMVKAAWQALTEDEIASGQYHMATVRTYGSAAVPLSQMDPCYYTEETYGLVALHIIQKPLGLTYFTFATFEFYGNVTDNVGNPEEDRDGNFLGTPQTNSTAPNISHTDSPGGATTTADGELNYPGGFQPYYKNLAEGLPRGSESNSSFDAVNLLRRRNLIPQPIIDVNAEAHALITQYNTSYNVTTSPWGNYKLVNVQVEPFNNYEIDENNPQRLPSTYYQANSLVETNYTLSAFSGRQTDDGQTSNYQKNGDPALNVYLLDGDGDAYNSYNMGGCMGCHGNAQISGTDFSFTLREGPVLLPEVPIFVPGNVALLRDRYKF